MRNKIVIPKKVVEYHEFVIDYNELQPWANWVAVDKSGRVYQYDNEPEAKKDIKAWVIGDGIHGILTVLPTKRPDWQTLKFKIERT